MKVLFLILIVILPKVGFTQQPKYVDVIKTRIYVYNIDMTKDITVIEAFTKYKGRKIRVENCCFDGYYQQYTLCYEWMNATVYITKQNRNGKTFFIGKTNYSKHLVNYE
jgi:hypothetical protein